MSTSVRPPEYGTQMIVEVVQNWSWLDNLISVAAIVVGAMIVRWQVKQNARENLRLDIYREIDAARNEFSSAYGELNSFVRNVESRLTSVVELQISALLPAFQEMRVEHFLELKHNLYRRTSSLMRAIEKYEIANPELKIFRVAFSVVSEDIRTSSDHLFDVYSKIMSFDVPDGKSLPDGSTIVHRPLPGAALLGEIREATEDFQLQIDRLHCNVLDLGIETQNLLLGGLFKHRVPRRKPIDPRYTVVSLDEKTIAELENFYENETLWGKHKREADERARNARNLTE